MKKAPLAVTLLVAALALTGCSASGASGDPAAGDSDKAAADAAPAKSDKAAEEAPASNWYEDKYRKIETIKESGTGDGVITLPAEVKAGIVTATHTGEANFAIQGLDSKNQPTIDLLVNTIGDYSGVSALGLQGLGDPATSLKISADGKWTLDIAPVSSGATIDAPAEGTGDGVYRYDGDAAKWNIKNTGGGNFMVNQISDSPMPNLAVNEIGDYSGDVPMLAGPSVVVIKSDGKWSVK